MPSLVVIFGRDRGRHFDIRDGSGFVLGREPSLTHRLNDRSISREHLEFVHDQTTGCMVYDLKSRNGARINGKKLYASQQLRDGDIIQVGYTLLVFVCVTFDARDSVNQFMDECEHAYEPYLQRLRDHASMRIDLDHDPGYDSSGGRSGTLHLGKPSKR